MPVSRCASRPSATPARVLETPGGSRIAIPVKTTVAQCRHAREIGGGCPSCAGAAEHRPTSAVVSVAALLSATSKGWAHGTPTIFRAPRVTHKAQAFSRHDFRAMPETLRRASHAKTPAPSFEMSVFGPRRADPADKAECGCGLSNRRRSPGIRRQTGEMRPKRTCLRRDPRAIGGLRIMLFATSPSGRQPAAVLNGLGP